MATNLVVELRRNEDSERLIRRFIKKCKKEKILETYLEKTEFYEKPSVVKKRKRQNAIREQLKQRKKAEELLR
jgi:ribosomal protein S21